MPTKIYIEMPENFSFEQTLFGHGWSQLAPFEVDRENLRLSYVFNASDVPVSAQISASDGKIKVEIHQSGSNQKTKHKITRDVRHILRLDDDLQGFYQSTGSEKRLAWIAESNAGRLLRSPTVYEDLVKTICTTNCSWALTKKMTANLVEKLGETAEDGKRAFPTAEKMAGVSEEFYKKEIRAGYRSNYFAELAEKVATGEINPESWFNSELPTKELKKQMKQIKGVGDYAAENLLKLVGRYDGLALDSYLRAQFYERHNGGVVCEDEKIENFYKPFGDWRGLTIWCDMSESKS
jgi:3-methyladenine DNA glycosylase/8-oxoguanine DNA glycosylase